jgi:hypothetical protein
MCAMTRLISYTTIAAGATRFAWHSPGDSGDGLLVDMTTASAPWCDVADVLLWPTAADPAAAAACAARTQATLAVIAGQPGHWTILTFSHTVNRAVTHRSVVCADIWFALVKVVVERYRAVLAERDPPR